MLLYERDRVAGRYVNAVRVLHANLFSEEGLCSVFCSSEGSKVLLELREELLRVCVVRESLKGFLD